jgi:hypothetical protein
MKIIDKFTFEEETIYILDYIPSMNRFIIGDYKYEFFPRFRQKRDFIHITKNGYLPMIYNYIVSNALTIGDNINYTIIN